MDNYDDLAIQLETGCKELESKRKRIPEIARILAGVSDNTERQTLKEERRKLQAEVQEMPEDLGQLARQVALADMERGAAMYAEAKSEIAELDPQLDASWADRKALNKEQRLICMQPGVTLEKQKPILDKIHQAEAAAFELSERLRKANLKRQLAMGMVGKYEKFGAQIGYPPTWKSAALAFGLFWEKQLRVW